MVGRLGLLDIIASAEDVDQDGPPDVIPAAVDLHAPPEFVEVASRDDLLAIIAAAEDDVVAEDGPPDVIAAPPARDRWHRGYQVEVRQSTWSRCQEAHCGCLSAHTWGHEHS